MAKRKTRKDVTELTLVGDVDDWEAETLKALLDTPEGSECVFYMDSAGGSVYGSLAVAAMIRLRRIKGRVVVLSECSSAALLVFAACQRRFVMPYSTFLFHRMKWESDKRVAADEAGEWARHFEYLEREMDNLLAKLLNCNPSLISDWIRQGKYVTGREVVEAGLAEMIHVFP
jgi:ATP-dependent protease ClpP protease subunit